MRQLRLIFSPHSYGEQKPGDTNPKASSSASLPRHRDPSAQPVPTRHPKPFPTARPLPRPPCPQRRPFPPRPSPDTAPCRPPSPAAAPRERSSAPSPRSPRGAAAPGPALPPDGRCRCPPQPATAPRTTRNLLQSARLPRLLTDTAGGTAEAPPGLPGVRRGRAVTGGPAPPAPPRRAPPRRRHRPPGGGHGPERRPGSETAPPPRKKIPALSAAHRHPAPARREGPLRGHVTAVGLYKGRAGTSPAFPLVAREQVWIRSSVCRWRRACGVIPLSPAPARSVGGVEALRVVVGSRWKLEEEDGDGLWRRGPARPLGLGSL